MNKKILIIGANGFLGYNLSKKIKNIGYKIVLLCRKKNNKLKTFKQAQYIYCDINNEKKLKKKLIGNFDYVINFSGNIDHKNKHQTFKTHYGGLKTLVKVLKNKKIKIFIQAGTSLEYGKDHSPQREKNQSKPISHYGKAKYLASKLLMNKKFFFKYIILRLYQVYGPYQKKDRLVPIVINSCLNDQKFDCTEGSQKRDFLYIDDLTDLLKKIIKAKKIKSGIYNVGNGKPITVKNVIKKINLIVKKGKPNFGGIKMRKDEVKSLYPNVSKVIKTFKWKPKTTILKGLKKTINYYEKN